MKNTKLIALVAVLVVATMVISIVVASSMNSATQKQLEENKTASGEQITSLQQTIDKLNQTITNLQNGIKDAEDTAKEQAELIEQLKQWGIEIKEWNEATAVLVEKIAELDKALDDLYNSEDEDGNRVYNEKDYQFVGGWWNAALDLYDQAVADIMRATSVAEMDKIIADLLAACKATKTDIEVLYATVESLEKDGITAEDKEDMMNSIYYFENVETSEYEGETNKARTEAQKALEKRIGEALKAYKVAATDKYVAMVNALPAIDDVKISHVYRFDSELEVYVEDEKAEIYAAQLQRDHLADDLGLTFTKKNDPVVKADKALAKLLERVEWLVWYEAAVDAEINDYIEAEKFFANFGLNIPTVEQLVYWENYVADVEAWVEEELDIVLDPDKAGYHAYIASFINHEVLESYRAEYDALAAELKAAADAYIAAVENIYAQEAYADFITANDAADVAFKALKAVEGLNKNTGVKDIDTLLGNEENEVFAAAEDHTVIAGELGEIKNRVDKLNKHVYNTILSVKHVAGCKKDDTCVCPKDYNENLNYNTILRVVNVHLYPIITTERAFTAEELLGEQLLADLTKAFVTAAKAHVKASVEAWANADGVVDGFERQVVAQIVNLYSLDLNDVVFSATYTEPTYDLEGEIEEEGFWSWSEETLGYFELVADYTNTDLYNDIYEGLQ